MIGKNALLAKYQSHWFWGIALFALFIELCFHVLLPVSISNDSYGYIALSRDLFNPNTSFERSVGYPVFLLLTGLNLFDNLIPVILVQAAMAVAIPLIVFKSLVRFGLGYAVLGALISCLYFYNFVLSLSVLTELAYVFSIAVYTFLLIAYFRKMSLRNLLLVIASCWLIALVRLSGSLHFFSLLIGISFYILAQMSYKNWDNMKLGLRHIFIAIAVFASVSVVQHAITNRTSSVAWPHFVFNWVYKDNTLDNIHYGIIKPENGPATQRLFEEIERIVTESPAAFDTLKASGSNKIQNIVLEENGKYSLESVKLLMDDLIFNNKHDLRSWAIEGVLINSSHGILGTSNLLSKAIMEAFINHPEVIVLRLITVFQSRVWEFMANGITLNIVSFPTAYHHQIPKVMNDVPPSTLSPNVFKQWAYDMFDHTGNAAVDRDINYPNRYPTTVAGMMESFNSGNLIGIGHYVGMLGTQIIRLCWFIIALGILFLPFTKHAALLGSLLSASFIPPVASVFISETDPRHLLMSSPVHVASAIFVIYVVVDFFTCSNIQEKELARE
jgi:hypothetical protein